MESFRQQESMIKIDEWFCTDILLISFKQIKICQCLVYITNHMKLQVWGLF